MEELENGFDAIVQKLKTIYPDQEGLYYGTAIPYFLGGNDPLDGVEVYLSNQKEPHWHYVTYGFSELYEEEDEGEASDEEDFEDDLKEEECESGFGFELTFRLKKTGDEPPVWPINLLQNLARYVFSSGNVFDAGHHMSCNGPVALEEDTKLTALGFLMDSELGEMDTPWGHVKFLQAVPLTQDEMEGMMCWDGESFLKQIEKKIPLCITDLSRDSLMEDADFYQTWQEGVQRDGSSTYVLYMDKFECKMKKEQIQITLGAGHANTFRTMLSARVGKDKVLYIQTSEETVCFQPSEENGFGHEEDFKTVFLKKEAVSEISQILVAHKGKYHCKTAPVSFQVTTTEIRDQQGNVIEVIE